jgi:hypothetical protein
MTGNQQGGSAERVGSWRFQAAAPDWRVVSLSGIGTWFGASSTTAGAALAERIAELSRTGAAGLPSVDLRASGVQVWIAYGTGWTTADVALAQGISAAARERGLVADPSVPQELEWSIDTRDKPLLKPFWQTLLGYEDTPDDDLLDPLRRDPRVWFYDAEPRPLRNRIHFDVSLPREHAAERARALRATTTTAPDAGSLFENGWSLLTDPEGNEVDLVPGDQPDVPGTEDWRIIFSGAVFYPTPDAATSIALTTRVADVADRTGMPLSLDLRADGVLIDTGKDRWEDPRFAEAARDVQAVARELDLTADPSRIRFFQACIDAADVPAVRRFWRAVLGYDDDPRDNVTDINDPRQLNHPVIFQQLDTGDQARRRQRNRIHLDLYVPHDQVGSRRAAALAAGGRLTRGDNGTIADPEGNEVDIGHNIAGPPPAAAGDQ